MDAAFALFSLTCNPLSGFMACYRHRRCPTRPTARTFTVSRAGFSPETDFHISFLERRESRPCLHMQLPERERPWHLYEKSLCAHGGLAELTCYCQPNGFSREHDPSSLGFRTRALMFTPRYIVSSSCSPVSRLLHRGHRLCISCLAARHNYFHLSRWMIPQYMTSFVPLAAVTSVSLTSW